MIQDVVLGFLSGLLGGGGPDATDERIERWRRRPFLLRWLPIVVAPVAVPLGLLTVVILLLLAP